MLTYQSLRILANMCREAGKKVLEKVVDGIEETAEPPALARRPELLSFATNTKKQVARSVAEGLVVEEVLLVAANDAPSEQVEWLVDSGAGRRVCNDLGLICKSARGTHSSSAAIKRSIEGVYNRYCKDGV